MRENYSTRRFLSTEAKSVSMAQFRFTHEFQPSEFVRNTSLSTNTLTRVYWAMVSELEEEKHSEYTKMVYTVRFDGIHPSDVLCGPKHYGTV